jgi:hypothetical protein
MDVFGLNGVRFEFLPKLAVESMHGLIGFGADGACGDTNNSQLLQQSIFRPGRTL